MNTDSNNLKTKLQNIKFGIWVKITDLRLAFNETACSAWTNIIFIEWKTTMSFVGLYMYSWFSQLQQFCGLNYKINWILLVIIEKY